MQCAIQMGDSSDPTAVVDSECRVLGLEGLWGGDASSMPSVVRGSLNAPTIMLAERAADIIKGAQPLPPATGVRVYQADTSRQR